MQSGARTVPVSLKNQVKAPVRVNMRRKKKMTSIMKIIFFY